MTITIRVTDRHNPDLVMRPTMSFKDEKSLQNYLRSMRSMRYSTFVLKRHGEPEKPLEPWEMLALESRERYATDRKRTG